MASALAAYLADPRVVYAQPDYSVYMQEIPVQYPDDTRFGEMWQLDNTGQTSDRQRMAKAYSTGRSLVATKGPTFHCRFSSGPRRSCWHISCA